MKNIVKSFLLIALVSTALTSCKKYVDGPKFSLASAKSRVSGDWKIESYMYDGADQTAAFITFFGANFEWDIEKDGSYRWQGGTISDAGTWTLGEDKDDIRFLSSATGSTEMSYRILRLKSKELWFKYTDSNGKIEEYHFIPVD